MIKIFFATIFIILIFRSFVFEKIATKALYDFDEARYAEIAKNTLITNNWLIPQSGGPDDPQEIITSTLPNNSNLHPYFWKPPLHTWIISLSFLLFNSQTELALRLPSLIFALLSLIVIFKIAKNLFPQYPLVAFLSVILFSFNNDFSFISSQGIAESQLLFFNLFSLYLLFKPTPQKIIISGISLGLSILTKSFATFWVFPLAIYLITRYQPKKLFSWFLAILLIILPWHLFMYLKFGDIFIAKYVLVNIIGLGLGEQNNIAPIYWYLKYALWQWKSYLILISLSVFSLKGLFDQKSKFIFLFSWMFLILIPFSIIKSKVWWYVFPFWVPFCIYLSFIVSITITRFPKVTIIFLTIWLISTSYLTFNQSKSRTDWNQGIKQLGLSYPNLTDLSVYKIPYESPLFYFNTGEISRQINLTTKYIITNQDYYQELDSKQWQTIDHKLGDYLIKRLN